MTWWVLYCKVREEDRARQALHEQAFETYQPQFKQEIIQRGSRRISITPLFPRYLFIKETPILIQYQHRLRSTPGVSRVIKIQEKISTVSDEIIDLIKDYESQDFDKIQQYFRHNDKVKLKSGPFKDIEAVFQQDDGESRAIILINLLSKNTSMAIEKTELIKIK